MVNINKKVRLVSKIVTRSTSRALRGNLSLRDLNSYVRITRNHDLERKLLERRNIRRERRMSESNANPTQNDQPKRVRRRRASFSSFKCRSRRDSINGINQRRNSIDEKPVVNPIVPFDENFAHQLNMAIDEDILLKTPERADGNNDDYINEIDEEMLLKTPDDVNENEAKMVKNTIGNPIDGFETDSQMEIEIQNENMTSERREQMDIDLIDIAPDSTSGLEAVENSPGRKPISPVKRSFKPLPAPFHVRGRRPSTGCMKMLPITEE